MGDVDTEQLQLLHKIISKVIHDMKNPLSGISGFVQLIEKNTEDESILTYCSIIQESLVKFDGVCSEVTWATAPEPLRFTHEKVCLSEVVNETIQEFVDIMKSRSIEVVSSLEEDLYCFGDRINLLKAISKVIGNAKDALSEGGTIAVNLKNEGHQAVLTVSDDGPGIPGELEETLLKPFVSYGKKGSLGLGLSFVKNVIDAHKGTVSVEKDAEMGTNVIIHFPLAIKEELL